MKIPFIFLVIAVAAIPCTATGCNYLALSAPVKSALAADPRNEGIEVKVGYKNCVDTSTLVFDLKEITGKKSRVDVFRVFIQTAETLKSHQFQTVELQYRGKTRFVLEGTYFRNLGGEYGSQNPVYTMRTFPSHVFTAGWH